MNQKLDRVKRASFLNLRSAKGRAIVRDSTGQNADKGHTSSPRIEMKVSNTAGSWGGSHGGTYIKANLVKMN